MTDETTEQQQNYSTRYAPEQDNVDTLILRLDPTPSLELIHAYLMRYVYNPTTKKYEAADNEPMFSEEGIKDLMGDLYTILSIETALTNLSENDIRRILREAGEKLHEFIWFNHDIYEIDEKDWNRIYFTILHKIEIYLRRAKDGKTAQQIAEGLVRREMVTSSSNANQKSGEPQKTGLGFRLFGR